MSKVAIIMGSRSDLDAMAEACRILTEFDVEFECRVMSAHRTPEALAVYVEGLESEGCQVLICGAGGAAHLAGVVASHSILPVIGVPMKSTLNGLDSLLSTVQMPRGIPVATTAIGGSGAYNAALLAVQILSLGDQDVREKFKQFRVNQTEKLTAEAVVEAGEWQQGDDSNGK